MARCQGAPQATPKLLALTGMASSDHPKPSPCEPGQSTLKSGQFISRTRDARDSAKRCGMSSSGASGSVLSRAPPSADLSLYSIPPTNGAEEPHFWVDKAAWTFVAAY